jgi:hypothetical protein
MLVKVSVVEPFTPARLDEAAFFLKAYPTLSHLKYCAKLYSQNLVASVIV